MLGPLSTVSTGLRPPLCPPLRLSPDLDAPRKKGWTSAARKLDVPWHSGMRRDLTLPPLTLRGTVPRGLSVSLRG